MSTDYSQRVCRFGLKCGKKRYPESYKTVTTTFEATSPYEARVYQWPRYIYLVMSCQRFTGESKCPRDKLIAEFAIPKVMFQKGHLPSFYQCLYWFGECRTTFLTWKLCANIMVLRLFSSSPFFLFHSTWFSHQYFLSLCSVWASALPRNPPYRNRVL